MGRAFECRRRAKEARWDKMSRVFPKLAKSITLAAKNGGGDPDMNPALRLAISNAKAENLPKDKIDAAIKRATGGDAADISEVNYEGKGPHGSLFYIECATDNTNRSVSNLKTIFSKNGGQLVQSGQLDFMFTRKAVVEFEAEGVELEETELELIDHGLEELEVEDGIVRAIGDYAEFANLSGGVEKLGITIKKAGLERIPTQPVEMTDEQMNDIEALLEKIEEDEDVQLVFTNLG
ncbi:MAG: YebC/PmpR family DNA-binding transcriptional regulator [Verrucomicrobiales bacterium]